MCIRMTASASSRAPAREGARRARGGRTATARAGRRRARTRRGRRAGCPRPRAARPSSRGRRGGRDDEPVELLVEAPSARRTPSSPSSLRRCAQLSSQPASARARDPRGGAARRRGARAARGPRRGPARSAGVEGAHDRAAARLELDEPLALQQAAAPRAPACARCRSARPAARPAAARPARARPPGSPAAARRGRGRWTSRTALCIRNQAPRRAVKGIHGVFCMQCAAD